MNDPKRPPAKESSRFVNEDGGFTIEGEGEGEPFDMTPLDDDDEGEQKPDNDAKA